MDILEIIKLDYWNGLVAGNVSQLIMILTAAVVVVLERYFRRTVTKMTSSFNIVARFASFLALCSIGYAALAIGISWALKSGLAINGGLYAAPLVLLILVVVAVEAQRQRHF